MYLKLSIVSLFILSVCSGCSFGARLCNGDYHIKPNSFTPAEEDLIYEATAELNTWVGRSVVSFREPSDDSCEIKSDPMSDMDPSIQGYYEHNTGLIKVDTENLSRYDGDYYTAKFKSVVMHELLHSFGLHHVADDHSVMSKASDLAFSEFDREECRRAKLCNN